MARYSDGERWVDAVQVSTADINEKLEVDGAPFNETPTPEWVLEAARDSRFWPFYNHESDFLHIKFLDDSGLERIAGPTDWILRRDDGVITAVCDWVFRTAYVHESNFPEAI